MDKIEVDEIYARLQEKYRNAVNALIDEAVDQLNKELAESSLRKT